MKCNVTPCVCIKEMSRMEASHIKEKYYGKRRIKKHENEPRNVGIVKDAHDVEVLTEIIHEQNALGAKLPEDLDSDRYEWSETGRLIRLHLTLSNLSGTLDLSGGRLSALTGVCVTGCEKLCALDVSGCTSLTELICSNNGLTELNVNECTLLKILVCHNSQLKSLDVSGVLALRYLDCEDSQLKTLDVSGASALETLNCGYNRLEHLDITGYPALEKLYCSINCLESLNISANHKLKVLHCAHNQLSALDVSGCPALEELYCQDNLFDEREYSIDRKQESAQQGEADYEM